MLNMKKNILSFIRKRLVNEAIDVDTVLQSIRNKNHVRIRYNDNSDTPHTGTRMIQPMAVGTTKKGYPVVRAFQVGGDTKRGEPKWKFFRLDRVESWTPLTKKKFNTAPAGYNKTGDKSMSHFIDNAKFVDLDTPLEILRAKYADMLNGPKIATSSNQSGPLAATQQWKKNAFTSQPNSKRYQMIAQNVADANSDDVDRWADYERAEREREQQEIQSDVPKPENPGHGPIDDSDYDEYEDEFDMDDFLTNNNKLRH